MGTLQPCAVGHWPAHAPEVSAEEYITRVIKGYKMSDSQEKRGIS